MSAGEFIAVTTVETHRHKASTQSFWTLNLNYYISEDLSNGKRTWDLVPGTL